MSETTNTTTIPAGTWTLDTAHSSVSFSVRHMMVSKVRGRFSDYTADIVTAEDPRQSKVSATIQVASIGSGAEYELHGDLTIRGVTKPVTFDLEVGGVGKDPWGNTRAGFALTGTINRKDFGMSYNAALETGGIMIGDKVSIELDIEATLQAE
jgi:polyisoprenoid-binding protein YceI